MQFPAWVFCFQTNGSDSHKCNLVSNINQIKDDTVFERHVDLIQSLVYPGMTQTVRIARSFFSVIHFPSGLLKSKILSEGGSVKLKIMFMS